MCFSCGDAQGGGAGCAADVLRPDLLVLAADDVRDLVVEDLEAVHDLVHELVAIEVLEAPVEVHGVALADGRPRAVDRTTVQATRPAPLCSLYETFT